MTGGRGKGGGLEGQWEVEGRSGNSWDGGWGGDEGRLWEQSASWCLCSSWFSEPNIKMLDTPENSLGHHTDTQWDTHNSRWGCLYYSFFTVSFYSYALIGSLHLPVKGLQVLSFLSVSEHLVVFVAAAWVMEVFAGLATSESSSFSLENTRAYLQKHLVQSFVLQWRKCSTENFTVCFRIN